MKDDFPEFDVASERFSRFLAGLGLPPAVVWTTADNVIVVGRRFVVTEANADAAAAFARGEYEAAAKRGYGVAFEAVCRVRMKTYARVRAPRDEQDAQDRQIGRGLKLSVPNPLWPGRAVRSRAAGWWYRHRGMALQAWEQKWGA
jgi:hypothetical protein